MIANPQRIRRAGDLTGLSLLMLLLVAGPAAATIETPAQAKCDAVGVNCGERYCVPSGWRPLSGNATESCWTENRTLYLFECVIG